MANEKSYIERDFEADDWGGNSELLMRKMRGHLEKMSAENCDASKKKMFHLRSQILPAIAAYKSLCEVMSEDEAFEIVQGYVFRHARQARNTYDKFMKIPGAYRLMPWIAAKVMDRVYNEEAGFKRQLIQVSGGVWRVDMTQYPYLDTCRKYGCGRLCTLFCDTDDICNAERHPKLLWQRTKTLGRGDDCCDFCLKILK